MKLMIAMNHCDDDGDDGGGCGDDDERYPLSCCDGDRIMCRYPLPWRMLIMHPRTSLFLTKSVGRSLVRSESQIRLPDGSEG